MRLLLSCSLILAGLFFAFLAGVGWAGIVGVLTGNPYGGTLRIGDLVYTTTNTLGLAVWTAATLFNTGLAFVLWMFSDRVRRAH